MRRKCPKCSHEVAENMDQCPFCQYVFTTPRYRKENRELLFFSICILIFIMLVFMSLVRTPYEGPVGGNYAITTSYVNGYLDYQKWYLDQDSINNLTGSTIELEVLFPNESIKGVYPFSLEGQFYIPQSPYKKTPYQNTLYNVEMNKSYLIQFHFVLHSMDPDIQKLIIVGNNNTITGTIIFPKHGQGLTFSTIGSTYNFSYEIWKSEYYLWFCKSLQFKIIYYTLESPEHVGFVT